MGDLIKQAFGVLGQWPLVQASVAILVLVIAALLAWSALKKQLPSTPTTTTAAPVPVQIESPWLVQHLVEIHYEIEEIKKAHAAGNVKLEEMLSLTKGMVSLLRRRAERQKKQKS